MLKTVRITSKRQITIPAAIFKRLNLNEGDRLIVNIDQGKIVMEKAKALLDELAGSLKPPAEYRNKSLDFIINDAKRKYFSTRK